MTISEIGLYIDHGLLHMSFMALTVIWLCGSPLRKSCCNGSWTEVIFNLLPAIILLMLVFAQWHFWIFTGILAVILIVEIAFAVSLHNDRRRDRYAPRRRRQKQKNVILFHRFTMLVIGVFCAVPCFIAAIVYDFRSPTYEAAPGDSEIPTQETGSAEDGDVYERRLSLLLCFKEDRWNHYSIQEKTTIAQNLAEFETELLGIPSVHLITGKLKRYTQGEYHADTNEMWIDIDHLANSPAEEVIVTICHEVHHSFEHYLVDNLDWDSAIMQTAYFEEIRLWRENQRNYLQPYVDGFSSYEAQPVEVAARAYAAEEAARILSYIIPAP